MDLIDLKSHLIYRISEYKKELQQAKENDVKIDLEIRLDEIKNIYNLI